MTVQDPGRRAGGKSVLEQSSDLLEFLSAVAREVGPAPVRDVTTHPFVLMPDEVPASRAVRLGPSGDRSAWLEARRVPAPPPVAVPEPLDGLIDENTVRDPFANPALAPLGTARRIDALVSTVDGGDEVDPETVTELRAEARAEIDASFEVWKNSTWAEWVARYEPDFRARRLYARLYDLHLQLSTDSATYEAVWGHAVLTCRTSAGTVVAPLLTTPVSLTIDPDDATIQIVPEQSVELELDAIEGTGLPGTEALVTMRALLREDPPEVWSADERHAVRDRLIAPLGGDAALVEATGLPSPTNAPQLNDGWALFLRKRPLRQERFYDELAAKIREEGFVPEALASVVADAERVNDAVVAQGQELVPDDGTAARLLMPLPANDEQERIASQLATARGVTVQGPPGTGKSHTIVNLISHLVAQGKRVLVTAEKEQALSVLRDKIPEELRDLSVAVLGSTPAAMSDLRSAVQSMQDSLSSLNVDKEERRITELGQTVDELRDQIRRTDAQLVEALRSEQREYPTPKGPGKAPEVAQWLAADRGLDVIPDAVPAMSHLPLTAEELADLSDLLATIDAADERACADDLPLDDWLPSVGTLRSTFDRIDTLRALVTSLEDSGLRLSALDGLDEEALSSAAARLRAAARTQRDLAGEWETPFASAIRKGDPAVTYTTLHNVGVQQHLDAVREAADRVTGHTLVVPDGNPAELIPHVEAWKARVAIGKKISVFARDLKEFAAKVTVDGFAPSTVAQLDLVSWEIHRRERVRETYTLMVQAYAPCAIPVPPLDDAFRFRAQALADRVALVAEWWANQFPLLAEELDRLSAAGGGSATDPDHAEKIARLVESAAARLEERRLSAEISELTDRVRTRRDTADASPLWSLLLSALDLAQTDSWGASLDEAVRLAGLRSDVARTAYLADRVAQAGAPRWASAIVKSRGDASVTGAPEAAGVAWQRAAARTWLRELHAGNDVASLMDRAHADAAALRTAVVDLAARSARVALKRNLRDRQRVALETWLQAIKKAGKGTGKNAPRFLAAARDALPGAMGSVPIWIMPMYRVLENFDPRVSAMFDVVVVDESSQCDLLSLGVLALGKKAVVVGDDKQTTPQRVGIRTDRIADLQDQHLRGHQGRALLTLDESLYSISGRAFPSMIALEEHFRCVPEIIDFSNRYYNGAIRPLREVTQPQIGDPLRVVKVEGAVSERQGTGRINRDEAAAIADQVAACISDPAYDRLSFGVVTMMSGNQAQIIQGLIRERIGDDEFERRRLRVGNPPAFQGDERNVIFISTVTHEDRYAATSVMYSQWANVAASRAQDQLWVFYSMDVAALNHGDQRRALIEYAQNYRRPDSAANLMALTDSQFERDVLRQLLQRGYDVVPQYRVGSYRIDFVVNVAPGERLAIECDGDTFHGPDKWDDDVRRQRVLERIGWSFWRIRASEYYLEPEASMEPLWARLESMRERAAEVESVQKARERKLEEERLARLRDFSVAATDSASEVEPDLDLDLDDPSTVDSADATNWLFDVAPNSARAFTVATPLVSARGSAQGNPAEIRAWARLNGYTISDRGRLSQEIRAAYGAAHDRGRAAQNPTSLEAPAPSLPSRQLKSPAVAGPRPPTLNDVQRAWETGTRYTLDSGGDIVARDDGRSLANYIGQERAASFRERLAVVRPLGGAFKVDDEGLVVTLVDGVPTYVCHVAEGEWFPTP